MSRTQRCRTFILSIGVHLGNNMKQWNLLANFYDIKMPVMRGCHMPAVLFLHALRKLLACGGAITRDYLALLPCRLKQPLIAYHIILDQPRRKLAGITLGIPA